jgi:tetratricopeptide (TPR) repeat protein
MKPSKSRPGAQALRTQKGDGAVTPAAANRRKLWPYVLGILLTAFAVFTVYGPALNGPFLLDDSYLPYDQPAYENAPLSDWMKGMRPMLMLSYWLNYESSGANTGSYHEVNVLLHLLNGILIYLSIRKILTWAGLEIWTLQVLSIFAAALFLLHPIQTESVSYIASRSETLSLFFFLSAFAVFLYRRCAATSWPVALCVLALFGAACLTKEHAVTLPALLLLTDYFWNPGFSLEGIRRNWRLYAVMAAAGALGLTSVLRILSGAKTAGFGMKDLTWYEYFLTQCRALWVYLRMYLLPYGQNVDHDFPISRGPLDGGAIFGLIGLIALVGAAWFYRSRFPLIAYGALVFLILIAPTSSIVPIRDPLVERRLYLPFIGLLLATVGVLSRLKISRSTLAAALAIVLAIEAGLAFERNRVWASGLDLWTDSVAKSPAKVRPRFQLAFAQYSAGRCGQAVEEFGKAAAFEKPDYNLLLDWALAYDCANQPAIALEKLRAAAALEKSAHVYSLIGMVYAKQGLYPLALDALHTAAGLDPSFEMTYVYRGNIYLIQNQRAQAAQEYRRALSINPQNQFALDGLARSSP